MSPPAQARHDLADTAGLKLLVVEDTFLVADTIAAILRDRGCEVVGPVARLTKAIELAQGAALDGAILDVNLAGSLVFPAAAALRARGVPFFFLTGYEDSTLFPAEFRSVPRLAKPFEDAALERLVAQVLLPPAREASRPKG